MLTSNIRGRYVIDPYHISVIDRDGISTPHVLGVDFGDENVLNDDVAGAGHDAESFAFDYTG